MTFETPPTEEFLGKFTNFGKSVIAKSLLLKLAVTFPENLLSINVLTASFLSFTALFKIFEFNPLCSKKKRYVKI